MEYQFSLTPRLAALGVFAALALLALLFALGFMLGLRVAEHDAAQLRAIVPMSTAPAAAPAAP